MTDKMDDTDDEEGMHLTPDCVQWRNWKVGFHYKVINS
jgi:hypothetical protein